MIEASLSPDALRDFLLGGVQLLDGIPQAEIESLARQLTVRFVKAGDVLLFDGDRGQSVYIVHSGLLEAGISNDDGAYHRIGWLTRGDWVGEGSIVTGQPRAATVRARRDSLLLEMDGMSCARLLMSDSERFARLTRLLVNRARRTMRPRPLGQVTAGIALVGEAMQHLLAEVLGAATKKHKSTILVTAQTVDETIPGWREELAAKGYSERLIELQQRLEAENHLVLYLAEVEFGEWSEICRRRADALVVFREVGSEPGLTPIEEELFAPDRRRPCELVLVTDRTKLPPIDGSEWMQPRRLTSLSRIADPCALQAAILIARWHEQWAQPSSLSRYSLFSGLSDEELAIVSEHLQWLDIDGQTNLVSDGDPGDSMFLIKSGLFQVISEKGPKPVVIAELGPGQIVGETALLSGRPRTATVRALRDGTAIRIGADEFAHLLQRIPRLGENVARTLAARAPGSDQVFPRRNAVNIVVFPLTSSAETMGFARQLASVASGMGRAIYLDPEVVDGAVGRGMSAVMRGQVGDPNLLAWLHRLEADHDVVIYACTWSSTAWNRRCLRQADRLVFVGAADGDPRPTELEQAMLGNLHSEVPKYLALIQQPTISEANSTLRWLEHRELVSHHHVRRDNRDDMRRLLRFLTESAVGVAFSGASSRGPAHLGTTRAMAELGIPIDLVAGSSSGAAAAALLATGVDPREALEEGLKGMKINVRAWDIGPPLTSLTSGKKLRGVLEGVFGQRRMEDQLIPCVITAVDINFHRLVTLTRGPMWLLVRSSMSLPVVFPPVWQGDKLLVDGGVLSYNPLDLILDSCRRGLAVSSDLDPTAGEGSLAAFNGCDTYEHTLSPWGQLGRSITPFVKKRPAPSMGEILFHTMCIPSFQQQQRVSKLASHPAVCVVRPQLDAFGLFEVTADVARQLEEKVYQKAKEVLGPRAQAYRYAEGA